MDINNMKDKIELLESGLQCDNTECNWKDTEIKYEQYKDYINYPCPNCGENVLTEEDYKNGILFHSAVALINSMSIEDINELSVLNGDNLSLLFATEDAKKIEENKDKELMVEVNLHKGIKFKLKE